MLIDKILKTHCLTEGKFQREIVFCDSQASGGFAPAPPPRRHWGCLEPSVVVATGSEGWGTEWHPSGESGARGAVNNAAIHRTNPFPHNRLLQPPTLAMLRLRHSGYLPEH